MSRSGGPTETRPMIESRARIGRKKEEGEDEGRGGNGDGFIHEVGLSGLA